MVPVFTIDAAKIRNVKVLTTIVGGRVVWEQEPSGGKTGAGK